MEGKFPYVYSHSLRLGNTCMIKYKNTDVHESKWARASSDLLLFWTGQNLTQASSISQTYLTVYLRTYLHLLSATFHRRDLPYFFQADVAPSPAQLTYSTPFFSRHTHVTHMLLCRISKIWIELIYSAGTRYCLQFGIMGSRWIVIYGSQGVAYKAYVALTGSSLAMGVIW